jgi:hypothetical protein
MAGTHAEHCAIAEDVLADLGLTEVRNTAIGNWLNISSKGYLDGGRTSLPELRNACIGR